MGAKSAFVLYLHLWNSGRSWLSGMGGGGAQLGNKISILGLSTYSYGCYNPFSFVIGLQNLIYLIKRMPTCILNTKAWIVRNFLKEQDYGLEKVFSAESQRNWKKFQMNHQEIQLFLHLHSLKNLFTRREYRKKVLGSKGSKFFEILEFKKFYFT